MLRYHRCGSWGAEHKGITPCRRGEADIGGYKLVGMNIGMDFDAALLFPSLRMPTDAFENDIGEERNDRRIDDLQVFNPLWTPAPPAVRGKHMLISGVQPSVAGFKDAFVAALVGIRECGAARHGINAQMSQFTGFGKHGGYDFAKGVEAFDHCIEHNDQVLPSIEVFDVAFSTVFLTDTKNLRFVEQTYKLTVHRLSEKMSTFVHGYHVL